MKCETCDKEARKFKNLGGQSRHTDPNRYCKE